MKNCFVCENDFEGSSLHRNKQICSDICLGLYDKKRGINGRSLYRCEQCDTEMWKKYSKMAEHLICSDECRNLHRGKLGKKISILNVEYWIKRGMTEEEARDKISNLQESRSPLSMKYWLKKGLTEDESREKITTIQKERSSKNRRDRKANPLCYEYWQEKGHSLEEAKKIASSRANTTSLKSMIERHGKKVGTKKFNKMSDRLSYTNSLDYYIEKYGEEEGTVRYNTRKSNAAVGHASKISGEFFTLLDARMSGRSYFASKGKEYLILSDNRAYFFDYTIPDNKIIIELNGQYWHRDPYVYDAKQTMYGFTSEHIWECDYTKYIAAYNRGFNVMYIWYLKNRKFRYKGLVYDSKEELVEVIYQELYRLTNEEKK